MINIAIKKYIYYLLIGLFLTIISCDLLKNNHEVSSPDGSKKLIFQWVNFINPEKHGYIKIYIKDHEEEYVCIRPLMDFPISIYWGDTINIWGGLLVDETLNNKILIWNSDSTKAIFQCTLIDTNNYRHYFHSKIAEGYYE